MARRRPQRVRSRLDKRVVWTREKMLALLAASALLAGALVAGLVLAVASALRPDPPASPTAAAGPTADPMAVPVPASAPGGSPLGRQDELAARPMLAAPQSAARPSAVTLADPGTPILLPRATGSGPAGVPTGFPRTPEGALAQLAAIDAAALSSASMPGARAVISGWAAPGGPTATSWSGVKALAGLLDAAKVSGGGSLQLAVAATPVMGLIKGTVGDDFVVPCVDFQIDVTMTSTARGAVADCQRMIWAGDRWLIGPGAEPAEAPSIWPGTDQAIQAGYRDLRRG